MVATSQHRGPESGIRAPVVKPTGARDSAPVAVKTRTRGFTISDEHRRACHAQGEVINEGQTSDSDANCRPGGRGNFSMVYGGRAGFRAESTGSEVPAHQADG